MTKINEVLAKGGNFQAKINGSISDTKLVELLTDGVVANVEREVWSKVFKGVKDRLTFAYTPDAQKAVQAKVSEALKAYFESDLTVEISQRVFSAGAGKAKRDAQAAYDNGMKMLPEGADEATTKLVTMMALAAAQSHVKDWAPVVEQPTLPGTEVKTEVEEKADETPDNG